MMSSIMSTSAGHSHSGNLDWVLKQRAQEIATTFRTVWDIYIKFYTVFLTFSLGAVVWLTEHLGTAGSHSHKVIASVFLGQSLLAAITSAAIGVYSKRVGEQLTGVEISLLGDIKLPAALKRFETIPAGLGLWCGLANAISMVGMSIVWFWLGFKP